MANGNLNPQRRPYQGQNQPDTKSAKEIFIGCDFKKWIKEQIDDKTVEFADKFGREIKNGGLTTSQIRNFFGEMRRIQMNGFANHKTSFFLLKPKLAYAVKRKFNRGIEDFFELFKIVYPFIDVNNDEEGEKNYKNLMEIMEAVLAYHKYHGGGE